MNTQAGDFYLSNEDADRIAASAGLSASEYDALAKAAGIEQQQRNQAAVQQDIDNKMQILANLNAASRRAYKPAPIGFVPMGMTPVGEQARIPVSASERLDYATKARELQQEIHRNLSEAGMIQGPVITGPLTPTPQTESQQPTPTPAPAAPETAPVKEEKKFDPFDQFKQIDELRRGFFGVAMSRLNQLPPQYHAKAIKAAKDYWEMTGPKLPPNALLPVQNPLTGEMIQGMAMSPDGKIVELPKTSQELPKELAPIATKRAEAISNADASLAQLDEMIARMSSPNISDREKIVAGKDFLPAYNRIQSQGPNVLGVDEAKRNGQALETEILNLSNLFNEKQVIGSDIPRFINQLKSTRITIQKARQEELATLRRLSPQTASYFEANDATGQPSQPSQGGGGVSRMRFDTSGKRIQ